MNMNSDLTGAAQIQQGYAASKFTSQAKSLESAAATGDRAKIREKAEEFEAAFLGQMLSHMFKNVGNGEGVFGGGQGEKIWKSQYIDQMGATLSKNGGIGVADAVERQLLKLQEV